MKRLEFLRMKTHCMSVHPESDGHLLFAVFDVLKILTFERSVTFEDECFVIGYTDQYSLTCICTLIVRRVYSANVSNSSSFTVTLPNSLESPTISGQYLWQRGCNDDDDDEQGIGFHVSKTTWKVKQKTGPC